MKISELFYSLQGEGKLTGTPSIFIRTSGCNLRCTWCDTPYASWNPEGENLSTNQILQKIAALSPPNTSPHIVITGGEPMLFRETADLIIALKSSTGGTQSPHITIETAGTLWLDSLLPNSIDLLSLSPKLANSTPHTREAGRFAQAHEKNRLNLPLLRQLAQKAPQNALPTIRDLQWKFVLSAPDDLAEIQSLIASLNATLPPEHQIPSQDILLMPEGTDPATLSDRSPWIAQLCKDHGYRFSPRLHVFLYGNIRGT